VGANQFAVKPVAVIFEAVPVTGALGNVVKLPSAP